ncbi:MAG: uncharacterized protein H6Q89_4008, partial [Myxococcaceae bacterium]|nr:uncharacterized protein [Myxococcaceae bacterium]
SVAAALTRTRTPRLQRLAVGCAIALGVGSAWGWREAGVGYFSNLLGWLQDGSTLTLAGGLRGVGTRLTLWLALLGGSLATASGRHVTIDVVSRALGPKLKRPLAIFGGLVAAVVCLAAAWGFTDFIARDSFGARESIGRPLADGLSLQAFVVREQLALDASVAGRVLGGARWDTVLTPAEWNQRLEGEGWKARFADVARLRDEPGASNRSPLIAIPGATPQGFLVKALNLIVPFGLLMIALRLLLWCLRRAPVEEQAA